MGAYGLMLRLGGASPTVRAGPDSRQPARKVAWDRYRTALQDIAGGRLDGSLAMAGTEVPATARKLLVEMGEDWTKLEAQMPGRSSPRICLLLCTGHSVTARGLAVPNHPYHGTVLRYLNHLFSGGCHDHRATAGESELSIGGIVIDGTFVAIILAVLSVRRVPQPG